MDKPSLEYFITTAQQTLCFVNCVAKLPPQFYNVGRKICKIATKLLLGQKRKINKAGEICDAKRPPGPQ
jgi:hypothetical protein